MHKPTNDIIKTMLKMNIPVDQIYFTLFNKKIDKDATTHLFNETRLSNKVKHTIGKLLVIKLTEQNSTHSPA